MVSVILLSIIIILFLRICYKYAVYKPDKFPPGPPRIPYFGSYLFLLIINYKWIHKATMLLSKIYKSAIIGLYLGDFPTVIVNNYEGVKEIFNRTEFDGRPDIFAGRLRDPDYKRKGIFFQDGPIWKEQRRFILRYLRDYGFGRRFDELESVIHEEIQDLIDLIRDGPKYEDEKEMVRTKGEALCPYFFAACSTNSFLHIVCKDRLPRGERAILNKLAKDAMLFQRSGDDYGRLLSFLPWIRYIFPQKSGFRPLRETTKTLYKFFKNEIDKNLHSFDESLEDRHFIDMYIRKMKAAEIEEDLETSFLYDQFVLGLVDFAFPPISAIGSQLSLLFQWLLLEPEVLRKMQAEIDHVVGGGRLPCLNDRKDMPYTEATIRECLRIETLVPSSIPHLALEDTELMGYKIAKNTIMIPGLYAFHMDKSIWIDPEVFRPERFFDENGNLSLKKDISLPFGAGKRLCAGETFARNMLFLITSSICQNFNVVLGPGQSLPNMSETLAGISISPPDFWVTLKSR